jgi:hypothetical protein
MVVRPALAVTPLALVALAAGPARAANVRLTIVSAKIDGAKLPKGMARSTAHLSDLACLSLPGLRAVEGACGKGGLPPTASPLDSLVRVEIGDHVIRTYPIPGTLTPEWSYGVVVSEAFLKGAPGAATFALYDYEPDGSEKKLGGAQVKMAELMMPGTKTLKLGTHQLTYKVETVKEAAPRTYSFRVPADRQMADLARAARVAPSSSSGEYVVIPVAEGESIEVTATGKVQPNVKKHPDRVAGPDGIPTIQTKIQFNQPGFRGCPGCDHAALIGQIGSNGFVVGSKRTIKVENAGLLVLAINDLKTEDNAGGFDVKVTVSLPAEAADGRTAAAQAMATPAKKKGSAADRAGSGIDPRVVQQIVDAHGAELDACVINEANPNGDVVLQFSIAADGSLLGVIVEKASPNLKAAGECMRKKALAWKFPPPRGVVTARYPLSFQAG